MIRVARAVAPRLVLDVGVGFGKYGYLIREYLDVRGAKNDFGKYRRENWATRLDGIEVCSEYIGDPQRMIYDHIYIGDVVGLLPTVGHHDFIWASHVLEHLDQGRCREGD